MSPDPEKVEVEVEGRSLVLTNLTKVLYPDTGFTRGAVIDYYLRIAPVLLPHIADRPLTLKRYPDGVAGQHFYNKHAPDHRPHWVRTERLPAPGSTSGGEGLQLLAPLSGTSSDGASAIARTIAEHLEREQPAAVVSRMTRSLRPGKVLVDWSQNNAHKTTIAPYSLRARARPTVSTPVTWDEVAGCERPEDLVFTSGDVLDRVAGHGDLLAPLIGAQPGPSARPGS